MLVVKGGAFDRATHVPKPPHFRADRFGLFRRQPKRPRRSVLERTTGEPIRHASLGG